MTTRSSELRADAPPGDEWPELRFQLVDYTREVDACY
jgi:hypothetical protein